MEQTPDIRSAISLELKAAAALVGHDAVENFFRDQVGQIVKNHFPFDAGGLVRAKCEADVADLINSLLTM